MSISELLGLLRSAAAVPVSLHVITLELPAYTGAIGEWREHMGKGKGQVLSPAGERSCAEAEIVRLLRDGGWHAGWVQDYGRGVVPTEWRWALLDENALPADIARRHQRIRERMGRRGGCWDVLAWKDDAMWYLEAKGPGDGLHHNQFAWWVAASDVDPSIGLAVVDWRMRQP
jgi:hypothetical protein